MTEVTKTDYRTSALHRTGFSSGTERLSSELRTKFAEIHPEQWKFQLYIFYPSKL